MQCWQWASNGPNDQNQGRGNGWQGSVSGTMYPIAWTGTSTYERTCSRISSYSSPGGVLSSTVAGGRDAAGGAVGGAVPSVAMF